MNIIEKFIEDSSKPTISVVDLLEQARTIACVLGDKKFAKFCEKELNGYAENEKEGFYYARNKNNRCERRHSGLQGIRKR